MQTVFTFGARSCHLQREDRGLWIAAGVAISVALFATSGCSSGQQGDSLSLSQPAVVTPMAPAPLRIVTPSPSPSAPAVLSRTSAVSPEKYRSAPAGDRLPRARGVYKVGQPYVINGQTYVPAEDPGYDRMGLASWYGPDFHGKETANGETFDMNALTAAHPTLPLPSYVYVTNIRNGRTLLVRVNNRGPYKHGRIIDLSKGVARALAFDANGVTEVRVRYAGRAPIEPDDTRERQYLAAQVWGRGVRPPFGLGVPGRDQLELTSN